MTPLKLCLCQFNIIWENATANQIHLTNLFLKMPANTVDVIILPEMFTTGFSMNSKELAETMDGPTIQWMYEMANQLNAAITGSIIIMEGGKYYNRLLWIEPNTNHTRHYDKKHLFTLAGEQNHYEPGKNHLIVEWKGWKIDFYICYDLRFPIWSRNTQNVDLMIYVANFPAKREKAWNCLLPARAIENQCYVAAVNRVGKDGNEIPHQGDSAVYDYEGNKIINYPWLQPGDTEHLSFIELDHHSLQVYKRAYPFLKDRDNFSISPALDFPG